MIMIILLFKKSKNKKKLKKKYTHGIKYDFIKMKLPNKNDSTV